jgi:DNA-binding LytR/AlgR family response regulator
MKVIIVEDEPYARNELKRLLAKLPDEIEILELLDSVEDTVEWLRENPPPDLLFLDIQLSDGLSFEIFGQVEVKTPVIFTTAYDEYAIKAFQVNSIDYLLKPIKQEALAAAVEKYKSLTEQFSNPASGIRIEQIEKLLELHRPDYKTRFIAKVGDQIKHIDIVNVAYFKAEDNEVMLVTHENNRYIIDYTLDQLTGLLDPRDFFRVNRSFIVTLKAIRKISKYFNSRLHLELLPDTDDTVLISRVKVPEFMDWIDK